MGRYRNESSTHCIPMLSHYIDQSTMVFAPKIENACPMSKSPHVIPFLRSQTPSLIFADRDTQQSRYKSNKQLIDSYHTRLPLLLHRMSLIFRRWPDFRPSTDNTRDPLDHVRNALCVCHKPVT